jgi:1-pyrroline-5-carboxylate dehydrogenase
LEGFVAAVSPFNFTAIGVNLAMAPVLMGNTVIWKPSPNAILSNYQMYKIFEEAGLPPGVINFVPCEPDVMSKNIIENPMLGGVAFTGSTRVFNIINKSVANNLESYRSYPRISGETGGKNFHMLHPSCDVNHAVAATIRSAFEYQGQKCSACARLYCPQSLWKDVKAKLIKAHSQIVVGQPDDFKTFVTAVIDEAAYNKVMGFIDKAKAAGGEILAGGTGDRSKGYFVQPTIILTKDPKSVTMRDEIFGPVLTVYVYDDAKLEETLQLVDETTPYGLTGAIFASDRAALRHMADKLRYTAGNVYINDKCTGAVVGQQPFGGARCSGSNDKPGAAQFLYRWVSARTIKENFDINGQISYPHQLPDVVTVE